MVLLGLRLQTFNLKSLGGKKISKADGNFILTLFIFLYYHKFSYSIFTMHVSFGRCE